MQFGWKFFAGSFVIVSHDDATLSTSWNIKNGKEVERTNMTGLRSLQCWLFFNRGRFYFSSAEFNLEWWLSSRFFPGYVGTVLSMYFLIVVKNSTAIFINLSINCIFNKKFIAKHIAIFAKTKTKTTFSFLWMKWKNLFIAIKIQ